MGGGVVCLFVFLFVFFVFVFLGGFKGQVRCPKGPPLALNPPYFLFVFFVFFGFCFLFFALNRKKPVFPLKKGMFVVNSSVFPFVCV